MFLTFEVLEKILSTWSDNRELIPDLFYYFYFLINLNCCCLDEIINDSLNDDFNVNLEETMKNSISPYYLLEKSNSRESKRTERILQYI